MYQLQRGQLATINELVQKVEQDSDNFDYLELLWIPWGLNVRVWLLDGKHTNYTLSHEGQLMELKP